jgi:homoserine O-acetyltransferase
MGGMAVLEWPLCSPPGYIRNIIPIATSARHSAWCISWGEAQRQSIYSDPAYKDGYYHPVTGQPKTGLGAARMAALLTYRSRDSFESRFGRKPQTGNNDETITPPDSPPRSQADEALALHNDGHRNGSGARSPRSTTPSSPAAISRTLSFPANNSSFPRTPKVFSAQSYLRYQGDKFTARFDANCYIHITRKMDTHDIARGRTPPSPVNTSDSTNQALISILRTLPSHALVISIQTDGLFTPSEQKEIASHIPHAKLVTIPSPEGHDGFLLEFEQMNKHILGHLRERLPGVYEKAVGMGKVEVSSESFVAKKTSVFGEAEVGVTTW